MKKVILVFLATWTLSTAIAQKEVKYPKLFYKDSKTEINGLTITIDNAVSTEVETKFKLKITNTTSDYIIYKPEESKFVINGKELKPKEKTLIIGPNESDFRVINVKNPQSNTIKSYSFVLDGLYKVSTANAGISVPDFRLPASQNEFKAGGFSCSMLKLYKESDATDVKFKCAYNGDKIGFVSPAKVAVKMPDGHEYAAVKVGLFANLKPIMLMKGQDETFNLHWERMEGGSAMDMQKVEMMIKWNETFTEASPEKIKAETIELQFDEEVSNKQFK
jgi:hypothetical protein